MGRPNLSTKRMVTASSFDTASLICRCDSRKGKTHRLDWPGERFLSKGFSRSTGGASVSTNALGIVRSSESALDYPPPPRPGYARRVIGGRKLETIIDAAKRRAVNFTLARITHLGGGITCRRNWVPRRLPVAPR